MPNATVPAADGGLPEINVQLADLESNVRRARFMAMILGDLITENLFANVDSVHPDRFRVSPIRCEMISFAANDVLERLDAILDTIEAVNAQACRVAP